MNLDERLQEVAELLMQSESLPASVIILRDLIAKAMPETTVKCSNCGEHVKMITTSEMCPKCFC